MTFNPFDKLIHNLKVGDLDLLVTKEVAEGYWIEYKSDFPKNHKIARSISSFANSYGGWYFIGVEADKTRNVATNIVGFDLVTYPNPIDKVREIIKSHIDPAPIFYLHLVDLGEGRAVLIAYIPDNQETPFILQEGRIYRRVGDSSNPMLENDRYALDRLVDAGRQVERAFEDFCKDSRTFSQVEDGNGWVSIFLEPYPLNNIAFDGVGWYTNDKVEQLIKLSEQLMPILMADGAEWGTGNILFNSAQITGRSIILRQVSAPFGNNVLTIEIFNDARVRFFIPLQVINWVNTESLQNLRSKCVKNIISESISQGQDFYFLKFFSIDQLWASIGILFSYYRVATQQFFPNENITSFRGAISIDDIWRHVPFIDDDAWADHINKFHFPIMNYSSRFIPAFPQKYLDFDTETEAIWFELALLTSIELGITPNLLSTIPNVLQKQSPYRNN